MFDWKKENEKERESLRSCFIWMAIIDRMVQCTLVLRIAWCVLYSKIIYKDNNERASESPGRLCLHTDRQTFVWQIQVRAQPRVAFYASIDKSGHHYTKVHVRAAWYWCISVSCCMQQSECHNMELLNRNRRFKWGGSCLKAPFPVLCHCHGGTPILLYTHGKTD